MELGGARNVRFLDWSSERVDWSSYILGTSFVAIRFVNRILQLLAARLGLFRIRQRTRGAGAVLRNFTTFECEFI